MNSKRTPFNNLLDEDSALEQAASLTWRPPVGDGNLDRATTCGPHGPNEEAQAGEREQAEVCGQLSGTFNNDRKAVVVFRTDRAVATGFLVFVGFFRHDVLLEFEAVWVYLVSQVQDVVQRNLV